MHSKQEENVAEHTLNVCFIAHALCTISKQIYGKDVSTENILLAVLGHDAHEVFTSDILYPIKYQNDEFLSHFRRLEEMATDSLLDAVPLELQKEYHKMFQVLNEETKLWVKAADLCDALLKCKSEIAIGNTEFISAEKQIRHMLHEINLPEVFYFLNLFENSFEKTIDENILKGNDSSHRYQPSGEKLSRIPTAPK